VQNGTVQNGTVQAAHAAVHDRSAAPA